MENLGARSYDNVSSTKSKLRVQLRAWRKTLSDSLCATVNASILKRALELSVWRDAQNVHIYTSESSLGEIDTSRLILELQQNFAMHIEQPKRSAKASMSQIKFDVILIPILGFDRGGFRLGLGSGWYDRFLSQQPQALKIGLAYAASEVEYMPREGHDVPLDIILTEKETMHCNKK